MTVASGRETFGAGVSVVISRKREGLPYRGRTEVEDLVIIFFDFVITLFPRSQLFVKRVQIVGKER